MNVTRLRMRVPDLRVQTDSAIVKQLLASSPGIDQVTTDYHAGIIEVTTAAQDGGEQVIHALRNGGYPPAEVERFDDGNHPA